MVEFFRENAMEVKKTKKKSVIFLDAIRKSKSKLTSSIPLISIQETTIVKMTPIALTRATIPADPAGRKFN